MRLPRCGTAVLLASLPKPASGLGPSGNDPLAEVGEPDRAASVNALPPTFLRYAPCRRVPAKDVDPHHPARQFWWCRDEERLLRPSPVGRWVLLRLRRASNKERWEGAAERARLARCKDRVR